MSVVMYGDEALKYCQIQSWDQAHRFDDSMTDYQFTVHRVRVKAMLGMDLEDGQALQDVIYRVRNNLNCPRQPLTLWVGGDATEEAKPPDHNAEGHEWGDDGPAGKGVEDSGIDKSDTDFGKGGIHPLASGEAARLGKVLECFAPDLDAGPRCEDIEITELQGSRFAFLNCTFVGSISTCPVPPPILSNRWECRHDINQDQLTTMTFTGKARVNPLIHGTPDNVRETCYPPLPAGFIRKSSTFTVDAQATTLSYTIVYKEEYQLPPTPFTTILARQGNQTNRGGITECWLSIEGSADRRAAKQTMLQRMAQIILSRFNFGQNPNQGGDLLMESNVEEDLFENSLSVFVRVQKSAKNAQQQVAAVAPAAFGQPVPGNRQFMDDALARGTALQKALGAAWKDCCASARGPAVLKAQNTLIPIANDQPFTFSIADPLPDQRSYLSPGHEENQFEHYRQFVSYHQEGGVVSVPYAQQQPSESPGGKAKTAALIRLSAGSTVKKVRVEARRANAWPQLPKPSTKASGTAVGKWVIESQHVELGADLVTYWYYLNAEYEILFDRVIDPETDDPDFIGGVSPMYQMEVADSAIPSSVFRDDLIEDPDAA